VKTLTIEWKHPDKEGAIQESPTRSVTWQAIGCCYAEEGNVTW
jgi:hypothetical protein